MKNYSGFVVAKKALTEKQIEEIYKIGKEYNWSIRQSRYLVKGDRESGDFNFFDYLKYKMEVDLDEVVYYRS